MRRGASGAARRSADEERAREARKQHFRRMVYTLLLVLAAACTIAALASPDWVVTSGPANTRTRVGILRRCNPGCHSTGMGDLHHSAWRAALFFFALAAACVALAAVAAIVFICMIRDRALHTAKISARVANVSIFIGALIWPIGLHNRKDVPCGSNLTEEAAYHMCNPWQAGAAIWLNVVAMVALALANCVSAFVYSKVQQKKKAESKKKSKAQDKAGWYEARQPILVPDEQELAAEESTFDREETLFHRQQSKRQSTAPATTSFGDSYASETAFPQSSPYNPTFMGASSQSSQGTSVAFARQEAVEEPPMEEDEGGYLDLNFGEDEPEVMEDEGDSYLFGRPEEGEDGDEPRDAGYMFAQPVGDDYNNNNSSGDEPEDAGYILSHPADLPLQATLQESEFDDGYLVYK